jgi:regulatory protein
MREDLVHLAAGKASAYCARRERTAQDVVAYLATYNLTADEQDEVLAVLRRNDFLNEKRYARAFAMDRFRFHRWGRNKIRHALRAKQVPDAYIEAGIGVVPEEDYRQTALALVHQKIHTLGSVPWVEKKAKTVRFMVAKGYEPDYIYDLLNGEGDTPAYY